MATDKDVDRRLRRTYGITLAEYNQMLSEQGGVCGICQHGPGAKRLHVDHDHKWKKVKIKTIKAGEGWVATSEVYRGLITRASHVSKKGAVKHVRQHLQRISVRALLCFPCNRALRTFFDDPARMEKAAAYLRQKPKEFLCSPST